MKRVCFLNFAHEEGTITHSRLVFRLLSNSLCCCFSVTMVSRFEITDEEYIKESKDKSKKLMKTRWIAQGSGRTFSKSGEMKKNLEANSEEYESNVLKQTLWQFYAFRNSVNLPSVLLTITLDPHKINYYYHICFQKLMKLPSSLCDLGSFSNFWKLAWFNP